MVLCNSRNWLTISFPRLGRFSTIMCRNIFFQTPSLYASSSWTPINLNVGASNFAPDISDTVLNYFYIFYYDPQQFFTILLISHFTYLMFCLSHSAIDSFYGIFNFNYFLFTTICLFFNFVMSLSNISCIFSFQFSIF